MHSPTSIVGWAALCRVDCPSVRAAKAVSLCLASATALGGTRHISPRRHDLAVCPTNHHRLSLSNLIGLTSLLVKAMIGPSLSKMSLRIGFVAAKIEREVESERSLICALWPVGRKLNTGVVVVSPCWALIGLRKTQRNV